MKSVLCRSLVSILLAAVPAAVLEASVVPRQTPLSEKSFRNPGLDPRELQQTLKQLPRLAGALQPELAQLGASEESALYDPRTGRWSSLVLSVPLVPGTGDGNRLSWAALGVEKPSDDAALREAVWTALRGWVQRHEAQLRVDADELAATPRVTAVEQGNLVFVWAQRVIEGVAVRDGGLTAVINHGNLVLLGLQNWGEAASPRTAGVSGEEARGAVSRHVVPHAVESWRRGQRLELLPMLEGEAIALRLAWVVPVRMQGDLGSWEGLVDATSGELLAFEDRNQYEQRKVQGGVFPVSNDGRPPDGQEQPGWPMPYADVLVGSSTLFTTTGGTFGCVAGSARTTLAGRYLRMNDTCGSISETAAGDIDLGVSSGTDCTVPAGHSAGDTHSSRSGFYELNRIEEQARGYLPNNSWLQGQLDANMNLNQTCNAFWDGSAVNFFKSGNGCRNTGEIAAIFDHEWGHGMDNNGTNPNISSPGEAIADIHAFVRLGTSCVGRGFSIGSVCSGYGDACDGTPSDGTSCTGVRDIDFMNHRCNQPHTVSWITHGFTSAQCGGTGTAPACPSYGSTGPCGRETHCEGYVGAETGWDLYARDLQAAPFNLDSNTALELAGRLAFLGSQALTSWYTCSVGGGCGATNGYLLFLAADDDNGNLNDGTPHMSAIRAAFERHEIHCSTPAVVNSGCAGGPTTAPSLTATPVDSGVNLSWTAVAGADHYNVYRSEGVAACSFGKVKIGEVSGTSLDDAGLLNGREYSYMVLPVGSNTSCFGLASACVAATPVAGPNLSIRPTVDLAMTSGDGDEFLDNCENANVGFTVENTGTGSASNVRLVSVTPLTHPGTVVQTPLPAPIASSLSDCATAAGSFSITANGMSPGETSQFLVEVTSDEIAPATRSQVLSIANVESDWVTTPTRTFNFDTDLEGWTVTTGTFTRMAGGALGTPYYVSSSQNLDNQCDVVRSPVMRLSADSTLSVYDRFQIEGGGTPYDRANLGVVNLQTGARTVVVPSSGQLYTLSAGAINGTCGTTGQAGWNGNSPGYPSFNASNWNAAAFNPGGTFTGLPTQIEIRYGTDVSVNGAGFHYDQVTVTNVALLGPDQQSNSCLANGTLTGTVTSSVGGSLIAGATVRAGATSGTTNGLGVYSIDLQPATYTVTASAAGHIPSTATGVVVNEAVVTVQDFTLEACQAISVAPSSVVLFGTTGVPFSQAFTQTGGITPIAWSLTGMIPDGISLDTSTGVLSGIPTQRGLFAITVTATDANGCQGSAYFQLQIDCGTVAISPTSLPAGTAGVPYSQAFTQTGGIAPITWEQTGTLPTGISFSTATAVLSGTPSQLGSFPITVTAVDANACTSNQPLTLVVNAAGAFVPTGLAVDSPANAVFEPGESVVVAPSWRNDTGAPASATATAGAFTGPGDASLYTTTDPDGDYGLVGAGITVSCTVTGNCFSLSLGTPTARPLQHWDASFLETLSGGETKTWTLHVGNSFGDVSPSNNFYRFVETLLHKGITAGCGPSSYCPANPTSRAQMAVFALVSKEGSGYSPTACGGTPMFGDVPPSSPYCKFIEELARRGVVSGCGGGNYCPSNDVTREQMAVFMVKTLDPAFTPPACVAGAETFGDVPASSPFCKYIEELARRGVVAGCGGGNYCPANAVTRDQMSVFLSATFALSLYGL